MTNPADTIAPLVRLDEVGRVLAVPLRALPEGCAGDEACAEPAVAAAVTTAARIVQAYPLRLGEMLPGLRLVANQLIGPGELRPRFRNALFRHDISTWGDLAQHATSDLRDIRGFGHGSVEAITRAAVTRIAAIAVDAARGGMPLPAPAAAGTGSGDGLLPSPEWPRCPWAGWPAGRRPNAGR